MSTADGNPLTGDPQAPDVVHVLEVIRSSVRAAAARDTGGPLDCGPSCAGCTAAACVSRRGDP